MDEKELRKLNRTELLELLLIQTRKNEKLRKKIQKLEAELSERRLKIENAGNLAEAMVAINGVAAAAQMAADQYLENIKAIETEMKDKYSKLIQETRDKAWQLGIELNVSEDGTPIWPEVNTDNALVQAEESPIETAAPEEAETDTPNSVNPFTAMIRRFRAGRKPKSDEGNNK